MKRIVGVDYKNGACVGITVDGILDDNTNPNELVNFKRVRHGHWVLKTDELGDEYTMCSNCMVEFKFKGTDGEMIYLDMKNTHYCPYCGAKNG